MKMQGSVLVAFSTYEMAFSSHEMSSTHELASLVLSLIIRTLTDDRLFTPVVAKNN